MICSLSLVPPDSQANIQSVTAIWVMNVNSLGSSSDFFSPTETSALLCIFSPFFLHDIQQSSKGLCVFEN